MGNILSNDEKLLSHQKRELFVRKNHRHHYSGRLPHRSQYYKYKKQKADFLRSKNENNQNLRIRSQSLNAIIDDYYWSEADDIIENELARIKFDASKPLIPRIKLRKVHPVQDKGRYKQLLTMASEPELYTAVDSADSSSDFQLKDQNDNDNRLLNRLTMLIKDQNYEEISNKPEGNYFSKNFDESIKRLQQIEKEHELIENDDSDIQIYLCDKNGDITSASEIDNKENSEVTKVELKNLQNGLNSENQKRAGANPIHQNESLESNGEINCPSKLTNNVTIANRNAENEDSNGNENHERISEWYSNLKERFEKAEQENERPVQEVSCRVTGAILKSANDCSKPEEKEKDTRHYFSKLVKSNKSLIDEELPDPDKVKNIRAMFQENLNSTLKKRLDQKLGGSLQNINVRSSEHLARPLSAQCYRNDESRDDQKFKNVSATDISGAVKDDGKEYSIDRKKLFEKYEKDSKLSREFRSKKFLQPKWTDTGSLSSGVSSDLSSYDTDVESFSREGTEQDEIVVSDDDLLEEVNDKHYVQNEVKAVGVRKTMTSYNPVLYWLRLSRSDRGVLERIRSFGTSVTYYGGEMISCSVGPLLSPTTQAIMEEISEKYGHEPTGTRSFEEFYRKYVETNEPNRKKKLGRVRSFGQSDVFQKPNVLRNSEIDMFKNDLEIEIGIKKPIGISQNSLKRKPVKSASSERDEEKEKVQEPILKCKTNEAKEEENKNPAPREEISNEDESTHEAEAGISNEDKISEEINNEKVDKGECIVNKDDETEEEVIKETKKEALYKRAQSAPEGTFAGDQCETYKYKPTEEILFGYEKSLINGKVKPDMEFEEFEVCEAVSEKLQKLEERNSQHFTEANQSGTNGSADEENCGENVDADNKQRCNNSFSNLEKQDNEFSGVKLTRQISAPERDEKYKSENKFSKYNCSKWPIETTVMVDIQKNAEQTPKIVKNEKAVAKTKLRLF